MNREKAREVLKQFDEVNVYYNEKFKEREPEVNELKEMQHDYTELSIMLNKTLDDPEAIRQHQNGIINDLMRKSDFNYDKSRLDDPRLTQPYSRNGTVKENSKPNRGLLFSGLAGLLLGASVTGNIVQASNNKVEPKVVNVLPVESVTAENIYDYSYKNYEDTKLKHFADSATLIYQNASDELIRDTFADVYISGSKGKAGNGWKHEGYGIKGQWNELKNYISARLNFATYRPNNPYPMLQVKEVRDILAEMLLRDLKDGKLRRPDLVLEKTADSYVIKPTEVKNAK